MTAQESPMSNFPIITQDAMSKKQLKVPEKLAVTAANLPSWPGQQDVRHRRVGQTKSYLTYMHNL